MAQLLRKKLLPKQIFYTLLNYHSIVTANKNFFFCKEKRECLGTSGGLAVKEFTARTFLAGSATAPRPLNFFTAKKKKESFIC